MRNLLFVTFLLCAILFSQDAFAQQRQNNNQNKFRPWVFNYPAVYYQPQIVWLPRGLSLDVYNPRVYTYRGQRYIQFGINSGFYNIPRVDTFNFYNGEYRRGR
jgi:hypothetical protein